MATIVCLKDLHEIAVPLQLTHTLFVMWPYVDLKGIMHQHIFQTIVALIPLSKIDLYQLFLGGSAKCA